MTFRFVFSIVWGHLNQTLLFIKSVKPGSSRYVKISAQIGEFRHKFSTQKEDPGIVKKGESTLGTLDLKRSRHRVKVGIFPHFFFPPSKST